MFGSFKKLAGKMVSTMSLGKSKGQVGGNAIGALIGIVVLVLIAVSLLPTIISNTNNVAGATATVQSILNLVPLMYGIGILVIAVGLIYIGFFRK